MKTPQVQLNNGRFTLSKPVLCLCVTNISIIMPGLWLGWRETTAFCLKMQRKWSQFNCKTLDIVLKVVHLVSPPPTSFFGLCCWNAVTAQKSSQRHSAGRRHVPLRSAGMLVVHADTNPKIPLTHTRTPIHPSAALTSVSVLNRKPD